jgi:WD40-like Beta Propeller Repeat
MTSRSRVAAYGAWHSPITSASRAGGTVALGQPSVSGGRCFWLEGRGSEGGRVVLVSTEGDLTPEPFNVRSRVHEYGGGAYVADGSLVLLVDFTDQRIHRLDLDGDAGPRPLTPETGAAVRYADLRVDRARGVAYCVREDHRGGGEPGNELVRLELDGPNPDGGVVLVSGPDFVAAPRLSPDGSSLAWLQWDHPAMPWDSTELWVAPLAPDGTLGAANRVAGGPGIAVNEPRWAPDGRLLFLSDESGWANPYAVPAAGGAPSPLVVVEAEFGWPQWGSRVTPWWVWSPMRPAPARCSDSTSRTGPQQPPGPEPPLGPVPRHCTCFARSPTRRCARTW